MRKNILYTLVCLVLIAIVIEIFSALGLAYLKKYKQIEYTPISAELTKSEKVFLEELLNGKKYELFDLDSELGWIFNKNVTVLMEGETYTMNSMGLRSRREYTVTPPPDKVRIAAFGCSFVFCADVSDNETWPYYLEKAVPNSEVLNYGIGSWGIDQAYLYYMREGAKTRPEIVLVGIIPDTVRRNVNMYRVWLVRNAQTDGGGWWLKPRFVIRDDKLKLIKNPCPRRGDYRRLYDSAFLAGIGQNDYFFKNKGYTRNIFGFSNIVKLSQVLIYNYTQRNSNIIDNEKNMFDKEFFLKTKRLIFDKDFEGYRILEKLCDAFSESIRKNGAEPVFVIFPEKGDYKKFPRTGITRYFPLINYMKEKGYRYLDILPYFVSLKDRYSLQDLYYGNHYTPKGNAIVALAIKDYLRKQGLL